MADNAGKKSRAGIVALVIKLGGKFSGAIVPFLGKLAKGLKVGKVVLAAASMASYAYLFTWKFSLMIMVMLFVHESGHIWAMKRYGMKTKGIYFIPFVGGAAVTESAFPSRKAEVVIAIMGPIWGFALAALTGCAYVFTRNPVFAAASSWMALINLFNLLPINPLDGGRIFKSIAFSIHSKLGLVFLGVGIVASVFLTLYAKIALFAILLIIGTFDLISEFERSEKGLKVSIENLLRRLQLSLPDYTEWEKEYLALDERVERGDPDVCTLDLEAMLSDKRCRKTTRLTQKIKSATHKLQSLRESPGMPSLSGRGVVMSAVGYVVVAGALWGLMLYMSHIPGAKLAMDVLKG